MIQLPQAEKRGIRRSVSVGGARLAGARAGEGMEAAAAAATAAAAAAGLLVGEGDAGRGGDGRPSRMGIRRMDTTTASPGGWAGSPHVLQQQNQLEPPAAKALLNSQRFTSPGSERLARRNGPTPGTAAVNQLQGPGGRPMARPFTSQPPSPAGKFPPGKPPARSVRGPPSVAAPSAAPTSQQSVAVPDTSSPIAPSRIKVVVCP